MSPPLRCGFPGLKKERAKQPAGLPSRDVRSPVKGRKKPLVFVLVIVVTLLVGCAGGDKKDIPEYFKAQILPPLQVPADLDEPYRTEEMRLPQDAFRIQPAPQVDVEALARPPHIIDENDS